MCINDPVKFNDQRQCKAEKSIYLKFDSGKVTKPYN